MPLKTEFLLFNLFRKMKKKYLSPSLLIAQLDEMDVVTASMEVANRRMFSIGCETMDMDTDDSRKANERPIWDE